MRAWSLLTACRRTLCSPMFSKRSPHTEEQSLRLTLKPLSRSLQSRQGRHCSLTIALHQLLQLISHLTPYFAVTFTSFTTNIR